MGMDIREISKDVLKELHDRSSGTLFGPTKEVAHLWTGEYREGWWKANRSIRFDAEYEVGGEDWQAGFAARMAAEEPRRREIEAWYRTIPEESRAWFDDNIVRDGFLFVRYTADLDDDDLDDGEQRPFGLSMNMNDYFYYACGDAEEVPLSEIPALAEAMHKDPQNGDEVWAIKRRGCTPVIEHCRRLKEAGSWDDDMERMEKERIQRDKHYLAGW